MVAFEITVNDRKVCVAGLEGAFSAMVSHVSDGSNSVNFNVSGTAAPEKADSFVFWPVPEIGIGDTIKIRIIETNSPDPGTGVE